MIYLTVFALESGCFVPKEWMGEVKKVPIALQISGSFLFLQTAMYQLYTCSWVHSRI